MKRIIKINLLSLSVLFLTMGINAQENTHTLNSTTINDLPKVLILEILKNASPNDILRFGCTNKKFNGIANKDHLWHNEKVLSQFKFRPVEFNALIRDFLLARSHIVQLIRSNQINTKERISYSKHVKNMDQLIALKMNVDTLYQEAKNTNYDIPEEQINLLDRIYNNLPSYKDIIRGKLAFNYHRKKSEQKNYSFSPKELKDILKIIDYKYSIGIQLLSNFSYQATKLVALKKYIEQGNEEAIRKIVTEVRLGDHKEINSNLKVLNFAHKQAKLGSDSAMQYVLDSYLFGWHELNKNDPKALSYAKLFASQGCEYAIERVITAYENGWHGSNEHNLEGYAFAEEYANLGSDAAIICIIESHLHGYFGLEVNANRAIELAKYYANKGSLQAKLFLNREEH